MAQKKPSPKSTSDHSGWLSPTGEYIERGQDHFTSLPRKRTRTAPSPHVDSTREGTMRGYSRLKHLGDQMNVDCLTDKMPLVEAWVLKHTAVRHIQFHIWSLDGEPMEHYEVDLDSDIT